VSTDHSLNAQTASQRDQLTTTHANNANMDKFKIETTWVDASLCHAMPETKSLNQLTQNHAVDVRLANGHNSCQISSRPHALLDHLLNATVDKSNHQMDTNALTAHQEQFLPHLIQSNVLDQTAVDNMRSNSQST
jgi:hypothetical protein